MSKRKITTKKEEQRKEAQRRGVERLVNDKENKTMSEEIKKEAQDVELNPENLDKIAGGLIGQGEGGGFEIVDDSGNGNAIGIYNTLEEATFAASGICPRCGKTFSGKQAIDNHIKEWASGQK